MSSFDPTTAPGWRFLEALGGSRPRAPAEVLQALGCLIDGVDELHGRERLMTYSPTSIIGRRAMAPETREGARLMARGFLLALIGEIEAAVKRGEE